MPFSLSVVWPFSHSAIVYPAVVPFNVMKMPRFRAGGPSSSLSTKANRVAMALLVWSSMAACSSSFFQITPEGGERPAATPAVEKPAPKPAPKPAEKAPEKAETKRPEKPREETKPPVVSKAQEKPAEKPVQVEPKKSEPKQVEPAKETAPPKIVASTPTVAPLVAPPIARRPEPVVEAPAIEPTPAGSDSAGIARLMHAAALWDAVRLFHPGAAANPGGWDNATVRRLTDVRTANTREQYATAMREWLSRLNDPVSRIASVAGSSNSTPAVSDARDVTTQTQIVATGKGKTRVADTTVILKWPEQLPSTELAGWTALHEAVQRAGTAAQLVIDLTTSRPSSVRFENQGTARDKQLQVASALSVTTVAGPGIRRPIHEGWTDERDTTSSSTVGWNVSEPLVLVRGQSAVRTRRLVIVANEHTALPPALLALIASKQATLVSDAPLRDDLLVPTRSVSIGQGMSAIIRTGELIGADGSVGIQPDILVEPSASPSDSAPALRTAILVARGKLSAAPMVDRIIAANAERARDNTGAGSATWNAAHYPIMGARLLALFKSWATLRNFHAYNELRDENIDDALYRLIPRVEAASDAYSYAAAMLDFASSTSDAQAQLSSPTLEQHIGAAAAPFAVRWIEGRAIVTNLATTDAARATGLAIGDEIVSADGYPMSAYVNEHRRYGAASNDWTRLRNTMEMVPRGAPGATTYRVRDASNRERSVSIERTAENYRTPLGADRVSNTVVRDLGSGFAFIDITHATSADLEGMWPSLAGTRALIVDARGVVSGVSNTNGTWPATLRTVLQRTAQSPSAIIARQQLRLAIEPCPPPESEMPSASCRTDRRLFNGVVSSDTALRYRGRVVVLIDERTEGVMEQFAMAMEAASNATLMGSSSAGAVGAVTATRLPGVMTLTFSGTEVRRPDGGQIQRVGLTPQIDVRPTVKGVRAGTDEVLERAQQWLKEQLDPQPVRRRR